MNDPTRSTTPRRPRRSTALSVLRWASTVALVALAAVWAGAWRMDRLTRIRVDGLYATATAPPRGPVTADDLATLPDPVRRYLEAALAAEQPRVESIRLEQRGELRLGEGPGGWRPFQAAQHVTVDPPGFLWDATVAVLPLVPARVVDAYEAGAGSLVARVLSTVTVASAGPNPEMDEGELLRYLAEAVWYPTALLAEGVTWEAIDDRSARATIEDGENTASLTFRFDDRGLVDSVHADARYRQEDDDHAPWTGYFAEYEERNGLLVPTAAEVEWNPPDGDCPYWRAEVEAIEHRFAG